MQFNLVKPFVAFDTLSADKKVPEFTLITGLNGAGKSRLLKGISEGDVEILDASGVKMDSRLYEPDTLVPKNEPAEAIPDLSEEKTKISIFLDGLKKLYFSEFKALLQGTQFARVMSSIPDEFSVSDLVALSSGNRIGISESVILGFQKSIYDKIITSIDTKPRVVLATKRKTQTKSVAQIAADAYAITIKRLLTEDILRIREWLLRDGNSFGDLFGEIAKNAQKPNVMYVTHNELLDSYPQTLLRDPFRRTFTDWFVKYYVDFREKAAASKLGDEGALTDEALDQMSRNFPWDISNSLLATAGLPYTFNKPTKINYHKFSARLTDTVSGAEVIFSELSSGEKTIISLLTALTYNENAQSVSGMPQVILLDEPDAHLHPSLTKFLLTSLQSYLVKELGLNVIMTTHSPVTVALAEDISIYQLRKEGNDKQLEKFSQLDAITLLTAGVPTLGVSRLDDTPVYTESNYDADLYQKLFDLASYQEMETGRFAKKLSFHPSAGNRPDGNRELVEDHIKFLTDHGATNVRGVVDWDAVKRKDIANVVVFAEEKRYSLENAVFDPILLGIYLIEYRKIEPSVFGLPENWEVEQIKSSEANAQEFSRLIANYILGEVVTPHFSCDYNGGLTVKVAEEYLRIKGHDLEKLIFAKFEELKHIKIALLKSDVFKHVMDNYPQFIPSEFFELFDNLQN